MNGNIDFATARIGGTQNGVNGTTVSTTTGTSSTSVINIIGTEDIGGGTVITGKYGLDPRTLANDSLGASAQPTAASAATGITATGLARDEVYIGASGSFGNVRLGSPNSLGLENFLTASPAGTGVGSGYAPVAGTQSNAIVNTRYNRSARYDSAVISGFKVSALYAPGADNAQTTGTNATGTIASVIPDARKVTEFNLNFAQGPLTANLTRINQGAQTNATGWYSSSTAVNAQATTMNLAAANYVLGSTTLYAQYNNGQRLAANSSSDGTPLNAKGNIFGVKVSVGQIDYIAQYNSEVTTSTAGVDTRSTVVGLRADYNLSKTSAVYAGLEKWDTGTAAAALNATNSETTGVRNILSVGLRKSF